ncbi:hypothetical protein, partial [Actinomadura sp. KC345]|uniref:hypothetical protein n=1 Tax=Actinomadura sp. KC345 TaxID=2530371 RepID=UPI0014047F4D
FPPAAAPPRARRTWPVWIGVGAAGLAGTLAIGLLIASRQSSGTTGSSPSASVAAEGAPSVERCEPEGRKVTDPRGRVFETWSCRTIRQGPLFLERAPGTTVGYLRSSSNWFVCQARGAQNPEGTGSTWLYTQGDDRFENDGWGWFPASSVSATWGDGPVPGMPPCTF